MRRKPTAVKRPSLEKKSEKKLTTEQKRRLFLVEYRRLGTVLRAAKAVGVTRRTIYNWRDNNKAFALELEAAREDWGDRAFELVLDAIDAGDVEAAKWLLTKPGHRFHDNSRRVELSGKLSIEQRTHIHKLEEIGRFLAVAMPDAQARAALYAQQEASEQ